MLKQGERYRLTGAHWPAEMKGQVFPIIKTGLSGEYGWIEDDWVVIPNDPDFAAELVL